MPKRFNHSSGGKKNRPAIAKASAVAEALTDKVAGERRIDCVSYSCHCHLTMLLAEIKTDWGKNGKILKVFLPGKPTGGKIRVEQKHAKETKISETAAVLGWPTAGGNERGQVRRGVRYRL